MEAEGGSHFPADTLLRTKLYRPAPREDLVPRQRLIETLQSGFTVEGLFSRKVSLFSAPAGYGKTTLVNQWLDQTGLPVSWLSLESGENDPIRFLSYLIAALQTSSPQLGIGALGMLGAPQPPPWERILTSLLNDLSAQQSASLLVLDDYHVLQSQQVHEILNFMVEHLPSNVHLVITSREDPPLPLHRMRARREVLDIRQSSLAFNLEEVLEFFKRSSGIQLSQEQGTLLARRTEGWVTGLQLAALSIKSVPDLDGFIRSFTGSNRYVLSYLFEEVFEKQPDQVKSFLLQTSILNRLCSDLADFITGRKDSGDIIVRLETANFFILPLDERGEWYRYHRLFADLLRLKLGQTEYSQQQLHERASQWYADRDFKEEAVEHALAGEHWELAGERISEASDEKLRRGEIVTLLDWCRRMPEETLLAQPEWSLAYAWPLILIGEVEVADRVLEDLKGKTPEGDRALQGQIAAAEAFLSRSLGDINRAIALSKKALSLLPEQDRASRGNLNVNLGLLTWHVGRLDEAEAALNEALVDTQATTNHYAHHTALVFIARTRASRGDLDSALQSLRQASTIGDQVPTAILANADLAALHYERDQLQSAWEYLESAESLAAVIQNSEFMTACHVQRTLFHMGLGEVDAARKALEPALAILQTQGMPPLTNARIRSCQVQLLIAQGELHRAEEVLTSIAFPQDAQTFFRFVDLNSARLHLARGDKGGARELLQVETERAREAGWGYARLALQVLQALAEEEPGRALVHLKPALLEGEAQGCVRVFINEGVGMVEILQEAARLGVSPGHVGRVMDAAVARSQPAARAENLIEPITEREMEVLRLLAAGLSNRQIAEQLVISLGTVKSHIHHIFGKLGVSNRTAAVARARDLNLF